MKQRTLGILILAVLLLSGPVFAAPATSEARGQVVDADGNPIPDARLKFTPAAGGTTYDGKTNKKGRYFVPGMFSGQGEEWVVEIEAEGYLPTQMVVESRTVNRTLIGDVYTSKIRPGASIPSVRIRPMGSANIDFTLAPEGQVLEAQQAEATAAAAEAAAEAGTTPGAVQRDPWDTALSRVAEGNLDGSLEFFHEAIESEPEDAERRKTLAKVLYQLERHDESAEQARQAIELGPDDIEGHMVLYGSLEAAGNLPAAKEALLAASERFPEDARVLGQLAFLAGEAGETDQAIASYERLTQLEPDDSEHWLGLADLYATAGQLDKSESAYEKVVELDPSRAHQVFFNLGALIMNDSQRNDSDTQRAIGAFRKALELKPDYLQAHKQLAFALLGAGDRAGAKTQLETYVKLAPDAPDSSQMQQLIKTLQ